MPNLTGIQWLALQLDVATRMIAELRGTTIPEAQLLVALAAEREAEARAELGDKPEGQR